MDLILNPPKRIPKPEPHPPCKQIGLPQSTIKINNVSSQSLKIGKKNNNSLPQIQTNFLSLLNNPEVLSRQINPFSFRNNFVISQTVPTNRKNDSKRVVSFSYGNKVTNTFQIDRNGNKSLSNLPVTNYFQSGGKRGPLENVRNQSKLNQFSKAKREQQSTKMTTNPLFQFQKHNQLLKVHKLGKKFKNVIFNDQNQAQTSKTNQIPLSFPSESQFLVQNQKRNLNNLSFQKSQYVYMQNEYKYEQISLTPEKYRLPNNIVGKQNQKRQNQDAVFNQLIHVPIYGQDLSQIHGSKSKLKGNNLYQRPQFSNCMDQKQKYPRKIDNKVYIQGQSRSIIRQQKRLESRQSQIFQQDQMGKISKISKISKIVQRPYIQFDQQDHNTVIYKNSIQASVQTQKLKVKIQQLQERLGQKQHQNRNLNLRLQNAQVQGQIQSEYDKLEIVSKLSQIQMKKLSNQLKMFKIKQKIYQNKNRQYVSSIYWLKSQIKMLRDQMLMHSMLRNQMLGNKIQSQICQEGSSLSFKKKYR